MHVLGTLTIDDFLRDYWQKKPLLIRNAWPNFQPLLSSQELAGLSLEEDIESRLIIEHGEHSPWQVEQGPFDETRFGQLPERQWTLLIQGVEQWIPEARTILDAFRFVPSWRIDDLMISYAVDGGSVGPHYDQYDVFLLQAEGQREWRIGQHCDQDSSILEGASIRVLTEFEEQTRYLLEPGDMLYLPPQLAHYGIAQGECMTYSIGFRAPSQAELAQAFLDHNAMNLSEDNRYQDTDLQPRPHCGEITRDDAERFQRVMQSLFADPVRLQRSLGLLMTEAKYPELLPEADTELTWQDVLNNVSPEQTIVRSEFARFAFSQHANEIDFFAVGQHWSLPTHCLHLVQRLCDHNHYVFAELLSESKTQEAQQLLLTLWQQNWLYIESE